MQQQKQKLSKKFQQDPIILLLTLRSFFFSFSSSCKHNKRNKNIFSLTKNKVFFYDIYGNFHPDCFLWSHAKILKKYTKLLRYDCNVIWKHCQYIHVHYKNTENNERTNERLNIKEHIQMSNINMMITSIIT